MKARSTFLVPVVVLALVTLTPAAHGQPGAPSAAGWPADEFTLGLPGDDRPRPTADARPPRSAPELGAGLLAQAGRPTAGAGQFGADAWRFTVAPLYLWAPSLDGDVAVGSVTQSFDVDFGDILENLDFAFTAHAEGGRGPWTALLDFMYLNIGEGFTTQGPGGGVRVDVDVEMVMLEFGGTYRLLAIPTGPATAFAVEVLGGGRYIYMNNEIGLAGRRVSADASLIDPMVGMRLRLDLTERLETWVRFDVAGFDLSDDQTKLTWNLIAGLNYRFSERVSAFAGYRIMDIEKERDSSTGVNLQLSGPVLGLNLYF